MTTIDDVQKMTSDKDCLSVVETLFKAIAYCETIRDIVEPKQQEVVDFFKFKVKPEYVERGREEIISKPSQLYLVDESDWGVYDREMIAFFKEKGLKHKEGCCPLLEAESLVRETKKCVADVLEPFTGISHNRLSYSLKSYERYFDLQMRLFAPKIKNLYPNANT